MITSKNGTIEVLHGHIVSDFSELSIRLGSTEDLHDVQVELRGKLKDKARSLLIDASSCFPVYENDNQVTIKIPCNIYEERIHSVLIHSKSGQSIDYSSAYFLDKLVIRNDKDFVYYIRGADKPPVETFTVLMLNSYFKLKAINRKAAVFVVFCYKAIELGRIDFLEFFYPFFEFFDNNEDKLRAITEGDPKENGRQLILSLLTVRWHVNVLLGREAETFEVVKRITRESRLYHEYTEITLSKNYSRALFLTGIGYIKQGRVDKANQYFKSVYDYIRTLGVNLPEEPSSEAHLNDYIDALKLARRSIGARKLLRILEIEKNKDKLSTVQTAIKKRTQRQLEPGSFFSETSRVKNGPETFNRNFEKIFYAEVLYKT